MKTYRQEHGVTLIEMLVVVAILGFVMAGIYGMLNASYQAYMDSRRRIESQQTARIVLDYLVFRLREIDGGRNSDTPWQCLDCHTAGRAAADDKARDNIPCIEDVSKPRKILSFTVLNDGVATASSTKPPRSPLPLLNFAALHILPQPAMTGNNISFMADLLPVYGFSESFTDAPASAPIPYGPKGKGKWDWAPKNSDNGDLNLNGLYDDGEFELLEDLNENSQYDVYSEDWNLRLIKESDKQFYTLVESMNFTTSSSPNYTSSTNGGKLVYNQSPYPDEGYTTATAGKNYAEIATGIVRLNIRVVPRYETDASMLTIGTQIPSKRCQDPSSPTACHGSSGAFNVYGSAAKFDLKQFAASHTNWNVRGFIVEVTAGAAKGNTTRLTTLQQFVIPRNLEINR